MQRKGRAEEHEAQQSGSDPGQEGRRRDSGIEKYERHRRFLSHQRQPKRACNGDEGDGQGVSEQRRPVVQFRAQNDWRVRRGRKVFSRLP